ncbi:hypothetical protein D5086_015931 [Populus alba]|uniref:Uncharacterized protein n=1 Tax=Populus alba TaxID=43335 RepID=A0ACC4BSW8_POPAL
MEQLENRKAGREAKESDEEEKRVHDSSVDYKGRVPLRSSTGVWKASLFIITIEFSERLCNFGITANVISYLTKVIHQDLKTAAKSVNYWAGVTTMMPLFGGFLADAYTGRFSMVLLSSLVYLLGLSLLTMSQFIPSLKPCDVGGCEKARKIHEVAFFLAMYSISLGTGGHKPCLQSFGADQFDDDHAEERKKKLSFFNWWNIALCCGLFLGVTVIVYIEDNVSWGVAILILTITMAVTVATFYLGKPYYRYRLPEGSGLTPMLQVLVAAIRKRKLPSPSNPALLYEVPSYKIQGRLLGHTDRLTKRQKIAEEDIDVLDGEKNVELPMSVFWLAPQFLILGLGDGFTLVGLQEFFYDQVPDSMRSLGMAFFLSVLGAGNFLSSFLITAVDHITEKDGKGWIGKDLNSSRLDKFYWLLAAINSVNIFAYVFFARRYTYKNVQRRVAATNLNKDDGMELMP